MTRLVRASALVGRPVVTLAGDDVAQIKDCDLLGKRRLSDAGVELGTVTDVDFDPVTGSVVSVIGTNGTVPGDSLVGCGGYAVVVRNT